jgi:hypothetical protein
MTDRLTEYARLVMSAAIVFYFGWALFAHWSEGIEETLKSAFMIAVGYWLGSSKGSADKAKELARKVGGDA